MSTLLVPHYRSVMPGFLLNVQGARSSNQRRTLESLIKISIHKRLSLNSCCEEEGEVHTLEDTKPYLPSEPFNPSYHSKEDVCHTSNTTQSNSHRRQSKWYQNELSHQPKLVLSPLVRCQARRPSSGEDHSLHKSLRLLLLAAAFDVIKPTPLF